MWSSRVVDLKKLLCLHLKIDKIYNCILHGTAINVRQHKACAERMKNLILNFNLPNNKNLIVSGHGNTVKYFSKNFYFLNEYRIN